jgi:hypothetical protein
LWFSASLIPAVCHFFSFTDTSWQQFEPTLNFYYRSFSGDILQAPLNPDFSQSLKKQGSKTAKMHIAQQFQQFEV